MRLIDAKTRARPHRLLRLTLAVVLLASAPVELARAIDIFDLLEIIPAITAEPEVRGEPPRRSAPRRTKPAYDPAEVRTVQEALNALGYGAGPVDGVPGRGTRQALMRFQADNGLLDDGRITRETVGALKSAQARNASVTAKPREEAAPSGDGHADIAGGPQWRAKAMRFLREFEHGADLAAGAEANWEINPVDLNDDGTAEVLAITRDSSFCGTAGCCAFVLDLRGPDARSIGDFIAHELMPSRGTSNGWRDLLHNGRLVTYRNGKYAPADTARDDGSVAEVQRLLDQLGHAPGPADGAAGSRTRSAIRRFKDDHALPVTGEIDERLVEALRMARDDSAPAHAQAVDVASGAMDIAESNPVGPSNLDLLTDVSCAKRPPPAGYARPTKLDAGKEGDLRTNYLYSDGPDTILVQRTDKVVTHVAGGGDDVIYIDGPQSGTGIAGDDGGDTFVVCRMADVDMSLVSGPKDVPADIFIVDESVFADLPAGRPLLLIGSFQSETDRLIVRAPRGTPVSFDPLYIHVGALRIQVLGEGGERDVPFDLQSIVILSGERRLHPPKTMNFARGAPRVGRARSAKVERAGAASLARTAVGDVPAGAAC
ncbi:peptidoglycan-binding domain-containing protein, partial [Mesorhizobium mediterraneum]|uniref:peptidoglycan-binding domain-containing protein n=1 Tax=Mesorhizobium mediterraneum TaxID=43617 RepID=UPI001AED4A69